MFYQMYSLARLTVYTLHAARLHFAGAALKPCLQANFHSFDYQFHRFCF